MQIKENAHLTYCTNIHPGESWKEVFQSLQEYCLKIQHELTGKKPFGIGLRLSQKSAAELLKKDRLSSFKNWLDRNNLYVFTMNGFPYGDFHDVVIKDEVHTPDWTTPERLEYTRNLINIMSYLLPEGMEGGISTSPLSYKLWFENQEQIDQVKSTSTSALINLVVQMIEIKNNQSKSIHIDLEPEPDGMLENTQEVLDYYRQYLFKQGIQELKQSLECTEQEAKSHILEHIQLCYDVCHFALAYEQPKEVVDQLLKEGVQIGKIQISAALKCERSENISIQEQQRCLQQFDEPTYLHQAIVQKTNGSLDHYSDLTEGIEAMSAPDFKEIRTHFHVPVFLSNFQVLHSTQEDIIAALKYWNETHYSAHLEVETYTWGVLPDHLQIDITNSIVRELEWVQKQIN
jgi:hypothetical protein